MFSLGNDHSNFKCLLFIVFVFLFSCGFSKKDMDIVADYMTRAHSTPLIEATEDGNLLAVKILIKMGEDVNEKDPDERWTPLIKAVVFVRFEIIKLLIANGAEVDAVQLGWTSLHFAAKNGNQDIAQLLIEKGADVNPKSRIGFTPLHEAVINGRTEVVQLLIAKKADINAREKHGLTPLHYAVIKNKKAIATLLINKGADINSKDKEGSTPLKLAIRDGRSGIAELLRKYGGTE